MNISISSPSAWSCPRFKRETAMLTNKNNTRLKTFMRDDKGNVGVVHGYVPVGITLVTGNRKQWTVTGLSPLERKVIKAGYPIKVLVPSGPRAVTELGKWAEPIPTILGFVHGAKVVK